MKNFITSYIARTGRKTIAFFNEISNFIEYFSSIFKSLRSLKYLSFRSLYTIVLNQIKFTGIDAIPLIASSALLLGATVIIQANQNFPKFGIDSFIGNLLVIIIARELGPLLTAVIVISRSGSAIAAEIATQTQTKEILSLELLGIDTKLYIVFPRIIASVISIFTLIMIFDIIAFFGGYVISLSTVFIPPKEFALSLIEAFSIEDLLITIIKSLLYGIIIPLMSCYYGLKPQSSFHIPIFVSKAVVRTLLYIFLINVLISAFFYM